MASIENEAKTNNRCPEDETPFQIDENGNPPSLGDMDMDYDAEVVLEEDNDIDDNDDEEVDAIDGAYEKKDTRSY